MWVTVDYGILAVIWEWICQHPVRDNVSELRRLTVQLSTVIDQATDRWRLAEPRLRVDSLNHG